MAENTVPKYRRQRRSDGTDTAFVELHGVRTYLGAFGSSESHERYAQVVATWEAGGRQPLIRSNDLTLVELAARYLAFAGTYYVGPDGEASNELANIVKAMKPLTEMYGRTPAASFGPRALKAVRQTMIGKGWSRGWINRNVDRIRRMFRWGTSEELIPSGVYEGLRALPGLRRGRSGAKETQPVTPVPDAIVEATIEHMTPTLAAMVRLARLTGMRPSEVCGMRTRDVDTSGRVWVYTPVRHKTQHQGRTRTIYIGPRGVDVLRPYLHRELDRFIFSPEQSERERRDAQHAARETPMSCGNRPGSNKKAHPTKHPGERYATRSFEHAIASACRAAFPAPEGLTVDEVKAWHREHRWAPNRLRHSFATEVRRLDGLEGSQILLGHATLAVTQVYAERDVSRALAIISRVG